MNQAPDNSRDIAVQALRDREGNVTAHLERLLKTATLGPLDRGLARELALGSLRRRATLEAVLRAFLLQPERHLPGAIHEILLLAIYQMLFMERVPAFAAVSEAVEQASRFHHRRQGGFVNGVLRTIGRNLSEPQAGKPPLATDVIPISPASFRKLAKPAFPDPAADPAGYLAATGSLPAELAQRWLVLAGTLEVAATLAMHANVRAPMILRVNPLRADVQTVLHRLAAEGAAGRLHANGRSIVLDDSTDVANLPSFREGLIQPQDPTALSIVLATGARPGMKVLDLCAAPGTKATALAELMKNEGSILALDVSAEKLQRIQTNCTRLGITIVTTDLAEAAGRLDPGSFDLVLADVPCSNTGVLARRAEARWRFSEENLAKIVKDQQFLAAAAARFVKPGGRLVYSTCSIEPQENMQIAQRLLRVAGNMELLREELILPAGAEDPTQWHDGGYYAVFSAR